MTQRGKKRSLQKHLLLATTFPLSSALSFSRPQLVPTGADYFGGESASRDSPANVGMLLRDDLLLLASSFTRIERANIRTEHVSLDIGPALVRLDFQCKEVTRHLSELSDKETFGYALEQLKFAGFSHDEMVVALSVAKRIAEATSDVNMTVAALLHGAVRQGRLSVSAVSTALGEDVALLVENCASMVDLHGHSRDLLWSDKSMLRLNEEQATSLQNMVILGAVDWRVVNLVLVVHSEALSDAASRAALKPACARLAREAFILAREALDVYAPLAARLGVHALKNELEELGFRHLHPEEHAAVSREIAARHQASKEVLDETLAVLKRALQEDSTFMGDISKVKFEARAKQPYSIWRKLLKLSATAEGKVSGSSLDQVLDQLALRVVFELNEDDSFLNHEASLPQEREFAAAALQARGEEMCYHVMGLVHEQWSHYDFRVKDYLKAPKTNGYQSLHTTALCRHHGKVWPFEVQVRTLDMHQVAEWGKAAHSNYKAATHTGSEGSLAVKWDYLMQGVGDSSEQAQPGASATHDSIASTSRAHEEKTISQQVESRVDRATAATPYPLLSRKGRSSEEEDAVPPLGSIRSEREYSKWLHDELKSTRLYVFMNGGAGKKESTIWDLAVGTSIKDAMWRHRSVSSGKGAVGAAIAQLRINGLRVAPDYKLCNGDEVIMF
mmetsp:Transcript_37152/g.73590  ORF Transcript_37152/g.73590 Transcript_37152/m.73590 type:complete len:674 (-) Transcript_37152:284-2305(-)